MKNTFRIKKTKNKRTMSFTGDLEEVIKKVKKELHRYETDEKRHYLLWKYEEAKREWTKWEERIKDLEDFLQAAKEYQKKEGEEKRA